MLQEIDCRCFLFFHAVGLKEIVRVCVGKFKTSKEMEPEESLACSFHKRKIEEVLAPLKLQG